MGGTTHPHTLAPTVSCRRDPCVSICASSPTSMPSVPASVGDAVRFTLMGGNAPTREYGSVRIFLRRATLSFNVFHAELVATREMVNLKKVGGLMGNIQSLVPVCQQQGPCDITSGGFISAMSWQSSFSHLQRDNGREKDRTNALSLARERERNSRPRRAFCCCATQP